MEESDLFSFPVLLLSLAVVADITTWSDRSLAHMAGLDENKPAVDEEFDKLKVQNTNEFSNFNWEIQ